MSSQEDLFATQVPPKKVKYEYVVLCDKDENVANPFSQYPTDMFTSSEIHVRWLESKLDDSSRIKSLQTLEGIPDKNLSLFGKIPEGIIYFITIYFISYTIDSDVFITLRNPFRNFSISYANYNISFFSIFYSNIFLIPYENLFRK